METLIEMVDRFSTLELVEHDGRSTLELVRHDETADAPERDNDATAFELDASCLAPETLPGTAPQLLYRNSLPEVDGRVNGRIEKSTEQPMDQDVFKPTVRLIRVVTAFVVVAAVTIGVGVGIWYTRRHHSSIISPSITNSSIPNSPTPHTPTNTSTTQTILNDTSLTAIILTSGDRQLYFQDNTGLIRYAVCTASTNKWDTSPHLNVSTNAKNHTPLAVDSFTAPDDGTIRLFYVSQSHHLNISFTYDDMLYWYSDDSLSKHITAPNTRSLSITSNPLKSNITTLSDTTLSFLLYENANRSVSALLLETDHKSSDIHFIDKSSALKRSAGRYGRYTLSTPFTSELYEGGSPFIVDLQIAVRSTIGYSNLFDGFYSVKTPPSDEHFDLGSGFEDSSDYSSIHQSDIANIAPYNYALWINGTRPNAFDYSFPGLSPSLPKNAFPFARLASVTSPDKSITYLYHQMNGTTLAEEQWDNSVAEWAPTTYITVLPSCDPELDKVEGCS